MLRTTAIGLVLCAALGAAAGATERNDQAPEAVLDEAIAAAIEVLRGEDREAVFSAALAELDGGDRAAIAAFYADRAHAPFWTASGDDRARTLLDTLADAGAHGLPVARYRTGELEQLAGSGDTARAEVAITRAFLRYARDMTGGVLDPQNVDSEINLSPERPAADALLARLGAEPLPALLDGLFPSAPEYRTLMARKAELEALARSGGWGERVPDGPVLRLGDSDPRVPALRTRLAALGHAAESEGEAFDGTIEAALMAFQAEMGLVDDGIFGRETRAALNADPEDRIGQILVNLERLRWMPDDLGERHVWVNIPDYTVSVFEEGDRVYHTRSVVGEAEKTRTPEFSDRMTYLVVNPTWYIPDSIAKRVYLPQLRQDPTVLARNNMRLFTRAGTEIDPGLVNFAELGDSFPFRVRQNPSASNALGRVKFMFPNQFAIYLHDTPNRELFDRDARAFSNGCVRLAKPFELAHYLLEPQLDDPEGQFRTWVDAGSERYVTLERPIDVHIVYRTAWADEEGVHFRRDVYGRDARVLAALSEEGVDLPVSLTAAASEGRAG